MNTPANLQLSPLEKELIMNSDWILTKNGIIQKVNSLLEQLQAEQQTILQSFLSLLPENITKVPAKISKGEKYKGLPYLILDQPRYFNKENIFAIRTLFWWGNFFSSTLHLSGSYKKLYEKKIIAGFDELKKSGSLVCINADQWEHHTEEDNFIQTDKLTSDQFEKIINEKSFIKISQAISLYEWNNAEKGLSRIFRQFISMLTT